MLKTLLRRYTGIKATLKFQHLGKKTAPTLVQIMWTEYKQCTAGYVFPTPEYYSCFHQGSQFMTNMNGFLAGLHHGCDPDTPVMGRKGLSPRIFHSEKVKVSHYLSTQENHVRCLECRNGPDNRDLKEFLSNPAGNGVMVCVQVISQSLKQLCGDRLFRGS